MDTKTAAGSGVDEPSRLTKLTSAMGTESMPAFDPLLLAVLANRFEAIVREMANTLYRTARSAVLNTAHDFSCAIVTADNQLLSCAEGLQMHVFGAHIQTQSMCELHPDLAPGDAFLHNDPYLGNTHPADHTVLVPVFSDGKHVFTVSAKGHQADCGNSEPSTYMPFARDVYQEGALIFPCVRVQKDYNDIQDIIRMCQTRIRVPEVWYGDYLAALGAARIGERRVQELVHKYGLETVSAFVRAWFDYSERTMVHAIQQLPAGTYLGSGRHDPLPGYPQGIQVNVSVAVNPEEGIIEADLRENADCLPTGLNLSTACTVSGVIIGVLNCLDSGVPRNAGSFRRIRCLLKEGSVCGTPRHPYSCSVATTNVVNRLINAIQASMAQIGEQWGLAEGGLSMGAGSGVISGGDWRRQMRPYVNQVILGNNGGPGSPTCDGWITYCLPDCAKTPYLDSVEILEQKYPISIKSHRFVADSGGAGRFRGGPASEVVYGPRHDPMMVYSAGDGDIFPPQGVRGGQPGISAVAWKIEADGTETRLPGMHGIELKPGEWMKARDCGGGGYGNPRQRDPRLVLHDVLEGWVSQEQAESLYGVTFSGSSDDESLAISSRSSPFSSDQTAPHRN